MGYSCLTFCEEPLAAPGCCAGGALVSKNLLTKAESFTGTRLSYLRFDRGLVRASRLPA
jgi:hypothetical protein